MITMDGVAPYAKVVTQKGRRYKHMRDFGIRKKFLSEIGIDSQPGGACTSGVITPGTEFMY